ncbi:hypothetical protein RRF57_000755 [Xylaria bambusicola]|uniref:DUF202 domain-containing protein n=1 Tax=Xylaria bambusicola TaxID=326684 RepID=A0AAN7UP77_9PEZI
MYDQYYRTRGLNTAETRDWKTSRSKPVTSTSMFISRQEVPRKKKLYNAKISWQPQMLRPYQRKQTKDQAKSPWPEQAEETQELHKNIHHKMQAPVIDEEDEPERASSSCLGPFSCVPVEIKDYGPSFVGQNTFTAWPLFGPLLFENENSDARDHCANERTFLASLRLGVTMSVVAVAIAVSFHLRSAPSALEQRIAQPLGLVFWLLSVACLLAGLGNYIKTVNKYSRKVAIVQSGWRTQVCFTFPPYHNKKKGLREARRLRILET